MRFAPAASLWFATGACIAATPADRIALECGTGAQQRAMIAVPAQGSSILVDARAASAWLRIAELGQDVSIVAGSASQRLDLQVPPRFGVTWLAVRSPVTASIARTLPGDSSGRIVIELECSEPPVATWQRDLARISTKLLVRGNEPELAAARSVVSSAMETAPDAVSLAWALHIEAQLLLLNERSVDAISAFARAEAAWLAVGDPARASAARAARAEDLQRAGEYDEALELAASIAPGADPYFAARMQATSCLALRSLARTRESLACFDRVIARFGSLGEQLERLSAVQDHALLLADLDRLDESEALARDALSQLARFDGVPGAGVPTVRGRTHLLLADLALRRGNVPAALRECDEALAAFTVAQATRWQGNALLRVAEVYAALGVASDASAAAEQAQSLFSPRDAPARVAAAALVRARLALAQRDFASAQALADEAAKAFESRRSAMELEAARIVQATARLRDGGFASDIALPPATAGNAVARSLLLVESDLAIGALDSASSRLSQLDGASLAPPARIERERLLARWQDLLGEHHEADATRWRAAGTLVAMASRSQGGVIRELLLRRLDAIRRDAYAAILGRRNADADGARLVLQWAIVDKSAGPARSSGPAEAGGFDALLARELLPYGGATVDRVAADARARSLRSLLGYLAASGGTDMTRAPSAAQSDAQPVLAPGEVLIALVDGGEQLAVLVADARSARLVRIGDRVSFRALLDRLARSALDHATPIAALEADAERIGATILGDDGSPAPERLFVVGDGGFDAIPWALVRRRGSAALVETTNVVLVTRVAAPARIERPGTMDVLVADAAPHGLPSLLSASTEAGLLGSVLRDSGIQLAPGAVGDRDRILGALSRDHAWVHVAAHGVTEPRRLGRSGIWTTRASAQDEGAFLSWLDPMARGVGADLVVLNACALARGDASADRSALNFASAVSRAGAREVVAAMWPISDSASATWIPAFYGALLHGVPDAAAATRAAQRALRDTRRFRHPAHWAGLIQLGTLAVHRQRGRG